MPAYCYSSVISEHIVKDNAGFLVCLSAPICRSGWQSYRVSELDPTSGDDSIVKVYRPVEEVTSPATVSSANGKPLVGVGHPSRFVDPSNASWVSKGHIQNIRVGKPDQNGDTPLLADLHVHDEALIYQIQNGVRELSCGYEYELEEGSKPGTYVMRNLRMNHCAVVPQGRAGNARIIDSASLDSFEKIASRYLGRDPFAVSHEQGTQHIAIDQDISHEETMSTEGEEQMTQRRSKDASADLDTRLEGILELLEEILVRERVDRPRNPIRPAFDSAQELHQLGESLEDLARGYLGKPVIVGQPRTAAARTRRASDRSPTTRTAAEHFEHSARAARLKMLGRK